MVLVQDEWEFEWDPAKSAANEHKHGMSFEDAKAMWDDPYLREGPARGSAEGRRLAVARVGRGTYWTAVFVYRAGRIRIISVRKSTRREVDFYEGN